MKTIIKLAIAAIIANGAWRIGSEYAAFYQFRDAVREAALAERLSDGRLRERIVELAAARDLPVTDDQFTIRREDRHMFVSGSYERSVMLFPGVPYLLRFPWEVDGFIIAPPAMDPVRR